VNEDSMTSLMIVRIVGNIPPRRNGNADGYLLTILSIKEKEVLPKNVESVDLESLD